MKTWTPEQSIQVVMRPIGHYHGQKYNPKLMPSSDALHSCYYVSSISTVLKVAPTEAGQSSLDTKYAHSAMIAIEYSYKMGRKIIFICNANNKPIIPQTVTY